MSARARGRKHKDDSSSDLARVVSDFKGIVTLRNAQAQLSNTTFHVPGALAVGGGTFDLESQNIDVRGKLAMEATLSKAAGGIKSIFLIPLDPFFKRKNAGAVLPFQITGTYSYPSFRASLSK